MFRLIKFFIPAAIGIYVGIKFEQMRMKGLCAAGDGEWLESICIGSELVQ